HPARPRPPRFGRRGIGGSAGPREPLPRSGREVDTPCRADGQSVSECSAGANSASRRATGRRLTVAVEAGQSSKGSVKTDLRENAVSLPGMLMQGIATIAPSFAILASFVFIVSFAGIVTPWAYLFGGALLALQALNAAQLAKVFPSAGGWYTW